VAWQKELPIAKKMKERKKKKKSCRDFFKIKITMK